MAHEVSVLDYPFVAENAMAEKYVVVELGTGAGQVDLPDGANDKPVGVIQNTASADGSVNVRLLGVTKALANAAITKGDYLVAVITTGRVATAPAISSTWTGTSASTEHIIGMALEAAGAAGDIISMLIRPMVITH